MEAGTLKLWGSVANLHHHTVLIFINLLIFQCNISRVYLWTWNFPLSNWHANFHQSIGCEPHLERTTRLFRWTVLPAPLVAGWQRSDRGTCRCPASTLLTASYDLRPQPDHPHPRQSVCQSIKSGGPVSLCFLNSCFFVVCSDESAFYRWNIFSLVNRVLGLCGLMIQTAHTLPRIIN